MAVRSYLRRNHGGGWDENLCLCCSRSLPRARELKGLWGADRQSSTETKSGDDGKVRSVKFWSKPQTLHLAATHLRLLVELSEQKASLEIRIHEMTPDQRRRYATEL